MSGFQPAATDTMNCFLHNGVVKDRALTWQTFPFTDEITVCHRENGILNPSHLGL